MKKLFALAPLLLVAFLVNCDRDECFENEVVCDPCPSNRINISFQSATGCDSTLIATVTTTQEDGSSFSMTNEGCSLPLLANDDNTYFISADTATWTMDIVEVNFAEPISEQECCPCYPVANVRYTLNGGDTLQLDYASGSFESPDLVLNY